MLREISRLTWTLCLQRMHDIKTGNESFESVAKFSYLFNFLRNVYCLHEEITIILNLGNSCNHYVQFTIK